MEISGGNSNKMKEKEFSLRLLGKEIMQSDIISSSAMQTHFVRAITNGFKVRFRTHSYQFVIQDFYNFSIKVNLSYLPLDPPVSDFCG